MDSYFLRDADVALVDRDTLRGLWEDDRIAIHHPGPGPVDSQSLNPGDYKDRNEKNAIRTFARIAREGGYVWCQCPGQEYELVGRVEPGTAVEFETTRYALPSNGHEVGDQAVLKTLPMVCAKRIGPDELIGLRAARPRKKALSEWNACGNRLKAFVEDELLAIEWKELSRELQETACAEYLRAHTHPDLPRLKFLMMPVGRTLQDIDIHGLTAGDEPLYAQVANVKPDFLQHSGKMGPIVDLRQRRGDAQLVFFGDVPTITERDGIWVVPTAEVFEFLWKNPEYLHRLFLF